MQRLGTPALFLGLAGVVAGFVLRITGRPGPRSGRRSSSSGGLILLLGLYAVFATSVRRALAGRATRYGLNAAVLIALILGVIALVEAVSYRHSYRVDLTENKRWSLSPQTVKVVGRAARARQGRRLLRPDQPGKRAAEDLLKQYAGRSDGKFSWEVIDADRNPLAARQYDVESYGTVVLEATLKDGQAKQEKLAELEEEKLTNALIRVTRPGKRTVYFLKGHGEKDPSSSDRTGYNQVKSAIEKLNYDVKDLLLARETKMPDDAAIVVVAGPQKDLLPNELDALDGLRGPRGQGALPGRSVPERRAGSGPRAVGPRPRERRDHRHQPPGPAGRRGPGSPGRRRLPRRIRSPATSDSRRFFPVARTRRPQGEARPRACSAQGLARTSGESWAETNQDQIRTGQVKPDPGEARGPLTIAAVATVDAKDVPAERKGAKARIVLIGDSDFASNGFLNLSGNRDFFLNTLSWLAEEENLIAVRPKEASRPTPGVPHRRPGPGALPGACGASSRWPMIVAGGVVVARRRGR